MSDALARVIHEKRFTPVRLREGYDRGEVDQFLDDVVATQQSGQPSGVQPDQRPAPAPRRPEQAPEPCRATPSTPDPAPHERPSVIEEKPGLWSRITGRNR